MKLLNVTVVLLSRIENGLKVSRIVDNPTVPSDKGKPVIGPLMRRLLSVKEVVAKTGLSKNKAQEARKMNPISYLADFEGQSPLDTLLAVKAA
jgi:hypothetical protein